MRLHILGLLPLLGASACFPEFEDRPYLLDRPTVLAVQSNPAEVIQDQVLGLTALVATPSGTVTEPLAWAFCTEPRRVEERTSVTASCLAGDSLEPIEDPAAARMLKDGCYRFGPVSPPTEEGEPPRRPSDPDPTGGYYVPVRVDYQAGGGTDASSFGFVRLRCDLAGATRDIFDAYQKAYTNNLNPAISDLAFEPQVAAGATTELSLLAAPDNNEPYVVYSATDAKLYDRVETLSVAWYVTGGTLTQPKQTLTSDELALGMRFETSWQAPATAGTFYGWAVLRDDRGGVSWRELLITVQ
jgi:hypothetical protein